MLSRIVNVSKKLAVQSAVPFFVALSYAWWDFQSAPEQMRTASSFIKSLGVAFFLVMWFVGQWFRTDKQINDAEQLSEIKANVADIKAALKQGAKPEVAEAKQLLLNEPVSSALLSEAEVAMASGLHRSALLITATAFEHALRTFAIRHQIEGAERLTGGSILHRMRDYLGPGIAGELHELWRARNAIVHVQHERSVRADDSSRLYDSFRWAIGLLTNEQVA